MHKIISCTTREKRDYEVNGIDYHFLSYQEFTNKVLNGNMVEAIEFNGNFYGSCIDDFNKDKINIGIFNPEGIESLLEDSRLEILPIYVNAQDKTRLLRALSRENNPNCKAICERFIKEETIFQEELFNFLYISTNNENKINKQ